MGTITYNVKYRAIDPFVSKLNIDPILRAFNQSLSTYIPSSEISQLNQAGRLDNPSALFTAVVIKSKEVFEKSQKTFDPTVGPLVNAWGFGPDKEPNIPDSTAVATLLSQTGFGRIKIEEHVVSMDSGMFLDFSAIAKGYAVDVLADYLEAQGVRHYMVEIGGEVRAKGINEKEKTWSIGIEDPLVAQDESRLLAIIRLSDKAMATSGNYRNYYRVGGRTIAHTIDPRTGYNTDHHLLSASVFAADCITADAYATAFMVLGLKGAQEVAQKEGLDVFLVYQKENGELASFASSGLQPYIELNNADE